MHHRRDSRRRWRPARRGTPAWRGGPRPRGDRRRGRWIAIAASRVAASRTAGSRTVESRIAASRTAALRAFARSAEQAPYPVPLLMQLRERRLHSFAAEVVDGEPLDDLVSPTA